MPTAISTILGVFQAMTFPLANRPVDMPGFHLHSGHSTAPMQGRFAGSGGVLEGQIVAEEAPRQGAGIGPAKDLAQPAREFVHPRRLGGAPALEPSLGHRGPQRGEPRVPRPRMEGGEPCRSAGIAREPVPRRASCGEKPREEVGPTRGEPVPEGPDRPRRPPLDPERPGQPVARDEGHEALCREKRRFRPVGEKGVEFARAQFRREGRSRSEGARAEVEIDAARRQGDRLDHRPARLAGIAGDPDPPVDEVGDGGHRPVRPGHQFLRGKVGGGAGDVASVGTAARGPQPVRHDEVDLAARKRPAGLVLAAEGAGDEAEAMGGVESCFRHAGEDRALGPGDDLGDPQGLLGRGPACDGEGGGRREAGKDGAARKAQGFGALLGLHAVILTAV